MSSAKMVVREYLRVSKDRGGRGASPDQQHTDIARAAEERGWRLHSDPYRDNDRSASRYARRDREDFKRLIADLEDGTFGADTLAIWESSRGSRRVGEWVDLVDLCAARGVTIWVTTHHRLYDPTVARDRRSVLEDAVDAEYESAKTSERIQRNVRAAAEAGRVHGKNLYGYERRYRQGPSGPVLAEVVPHPAQAPIVQEAARRVLAGESFYAIAKDFNERGIAPRRPSYKQHRSGLGWTPPAVKAMLAMPAYAGKRQYRGEIVSNAVWAPLIDYETWQKLQTVMSPPERKRTNDWVAVHLLSGIAVCGICGAGMRAGKQNSGRRKDSQGKPLPRPRDEDGNELPYPYYYSYLCAGTPGKTRFHVAMKQEHLDLVVTELVIARLERPDFLAIIGDHSDDVDAERRTLLDEIKGHQEYLEEVRAEAAARRRMDLLWDQEDRIAPQIKVAQERLERLSQTDPLVLSLIESGSIRKAWQGLALVEKRRVIRDIVTPRINRTQKRGLKGVDFDRVEPFWR